jgi:hypothetical protein
MKHLRLFENLYKLNEEELNSIKDLCDLHFAYLYDEGYIIKVENKVENFGNDGRILKPYTNINIRKGDEFSSDVFTWSYIKDHFIPFTEQLNSEYPLSMITFRKRENILGWVYKSYNIEDILSDNINQNLKIREVSIRI